MCAGGLCCSAHRLLSSLRALSLPGPGWAVVGWAHSHTSLLLVQKSAPAQRATLLGE